MTKRKHIRQELNAEILAGMSAEHLNMKLQEACAQNWSPAAVAAVLDAFKDKNLINKETIVDAAELGRAEMIDVLTRKIPASEAQDFYDRALIASAVYSVATQNEYVAVAKLLLQRGADPQAHESSALMLAQSYSGKERIAEMIEAAADLREKARAVPAHKNDQKPPRL